MILTSPVNLGIILETPGLNLGIIVETPGLINPGNNSDTPGLT